ncbi:MAG: malate synthase G, partial [Rhodobacteraceae bacterium]
TNLSKEEILGELENNAQGILGYVVRWINQGVGCSKVLDIYDVYLMEDRATCRIASQYLANWFHHGLISRQEILDAFEKMALKVDKQNEGAMGYNKLSTNPRTPAFLAALELVFEGQNQSCGYIEETMFKYRRQILSGIVES